MSPSHEETALRAYVGMGSNLGDRAGNLLLGARGMLRAGLRLTRLSSVYETERLTLPHPRLHLRRFALAPLAELAPGALHPALNQTVARLLAATPERPYVRPWDPK